MPSIAVNGPQPYEVRIGTDLNRDIAQRCAQIGAGQAGIICQPPLRSAAERLAELVAAEGVEPTLIDVPDAEAAKQLSVIGSVWDQLGEKGFNRRDAIIGLGGGAVLTDSTRELLERHTVIFLDISPEEGARRTSGDSNRPVLAAADPLEHYRNLVEARRPYYQEVADYRVRTDARTPQQVVGDILGFLDTL